MKNIPSAVHGEATDLAVRELAPSGAGGPPRSSFAWEGIFVALVAGIALLLFSPLNVPVLARDEGVFVYIGRQILRGAIPYRDLWDHKGPLIYYLNALGLLIGDGSLWGIWVVEAVVLGPSLVLLYLLLRRTLGGAPSAFGVLTWLTGFMIVMGGNIVEEYAVPLVVCSVCLAVLRPRAACLLAGMLTALAVLLRPNEAAAPALAFLFVSRARMEQSHWRGLLGGALEFVIAFTAVTGGVAAYFAANHALDDLVSAVFGFNFRYVAGGGNFAASLVSGIGYLSVPALFALAALPAALLVQQAPRERQKTLLYFGIALLATTIPLSLLSGRVYRHYYVPWLVPLSILSAYFCFLLQRASRRGKPGRTLWVLSWSVLALAAVIGVRIRANPLLAAGTPPRELRAVNDIQRLVPMDRALLIWGNETSYAVMADRSLASRFIYIAPLLTPGYGEVLAPQLLEEIEANRPVIIDTSPSDEEIPPLSSEPPYPYLKDIYSFMHANYTAAGTIGEDRWVLWLPK